MAVRTDGRTSFGETLAATNADARAETARAEAERRLAEARERRFDSLVGEERDRLAAAHGQLQKSAEGILVLANVNIRELPEVLKSVGSFGDKDAEAWRKAFSLGGVRVPDNGRLITVTNGASPRNAYGVMSPFSFEAVDPFAAQTAAQAIVPAYLPTVAERGSFALTGAAEERRRRYVEAKGGWFADFVAGGLAVRAAQADLEAQAGATIAHALVNEKASENIGDVFAAAVLATGIDPERFDPELFTGLQIPDAMQTQLAITHSATT